MKVLSSFIRKIQILPERWQLPAFLGVAFICISAVAAMIFWGVSMTRNAIEDHRDGAAAKAEAAETARQAEISAAATKAVKEALADASTKNTKVLRERVEKVGRTAEKSGFDEARVYYRRIFTEMPRAWQKWADPERFGRELSKRPVGDQASLTSRFSGIATFGAEADPYGNVVVSLKGAPVEMMLDRIYGHRDKLPIYDASGRRLGPIGIARLMDEEVAFMGDFYTHGTGEGERNVCRRLYLKRLRR